MLGIEEITVRTELEIEDGVNPNELMAQIYAAIDQFIAPNIDIWSLNDLLEQGRSPEAIFNGPALDRGFIDDDQLNQFDRKSALHTSDLIHIILDMAGVKTVKSIAIASSQSSEFENWSLALDPNLVPRIKPLNNALADFTFYQGQISLMLDFSQVQQSLAERSASQRSDLTHQSHSQPHSQPLDLPIPIGEYRELLNYETIQNEFPLTYGIGDSGLPPSASPLRKAQAKQLQAYIAVFDQLLANACAQLEGIKDLFSLRNSDIKTYFTQSILHHPGVSELLDADYLQALENPTDADTNDDAKISRDRKNLDRKNRLLNHLLAQFSEKFTDDALLFPNAPRSAEVVPKKVDFLSDYLRISSGRGQGLNTASDPNATDRSENISGLKRRISRLLGIPAAQTFLASGTQEGFHIVEHILMRPRDGSSSDTNQEAGFLGFSKPISAFSQSETAGQVTCTSPGHRLKQKESIHIFYSSHYTGTYTAIPRFLDGQPNGPIDPDSFDIVAEYVLEDENIAPDIGEWVSIHQSADPFSFQISVVIPDWPERFQNENFKRLLYDTLMAETPAHITIYLHWCDRATLTEFETTYLLWRQTLAGTASAELNAKDVTYRLLDMLHIGSSDIPGLPPILGYMGVGEDFLVY